MLFTDPVFLFLLLPVACITFYWLTPRFGSSAGFTLLLIISLSLYWSWGTYYLVLLTLSFTVNFIAACIILVAADEQRAVRRGALYFGQLYNFGTLIWFKYRFALYLFGKTPQGYSLIDAAIPIGISFYTFQQAILLIDAYHRDACVVAYMGNMHTLLGKLQGYLRHAFFVSFFPHLVIGPIVYLKEFQPQIERANFGRPKRVNLEVGTGLIIVGLFKKMIIADHLGPIADDAFGAAASAHPGTHIPMAVAWCGTLAYYAQLYFDFSGYSDLALGSARMLGIRFPINFNSPLKAVGIADFYRRWHITLTRTIARFIFTPLSLKGTRLAVQSRLPKLPAMAISLWLPLLFNLEVIALWHGARLTFIIFGVLHGIWYIAETGLRSNGSFKAWRNRMSDRTLGILGRITFFLLMPLTFALFRSSTVPDYLYLLRSMFGFEAGNPPIKSIVEVLGALAIIGLLPNSIELFARYRPGIQTYACEDYTPSRLRVRWRPDLLWTLLMTGMLISCLYYMARQPPFLYLGF
jgi:alginate O-acetyltransferase complex protein AlgI